MSYNQPMDFLSGTKILEEIDSPINGKIQVVKSLGFGTYIQVEGLTQSGGVVYDVWKATLRQVQRRKRIVHRCLILGLGGGSAATLVHKFWPQAKITGVDIDPVMVELGTRYLALGGGDVDTVIADAYKYSKQLSVSSNHFDLILIDLYVGYEVPQKFETEEFIKLVGSLLASDGSAVFNRLYFGEKRAEAVKFGEKLKKIFPKVEYFYPEANVMFLCSP